MRQIERRGLGVEDREHDLGYRIYEGWNFNSGTYLFTTDTK